MTANEVDAALTAESAAVGPRLLQITEDQWFDRKSIRISPKDLGRHLVAFANAEGGVIVLGLSDGRVEGLRSNVDRLNGLRQAAMDYTTPPVRSKFSQIRCVNDAGEVDTLAVIHIEPSERVHETTAGDAYLRVGDESRKLSFAQRQELVFDKGESQYDGQVAAGVNIEDLSSALVTNYVSQTGTKLRANRILQNRSLITRQYEVTNAGYLLFGEHPQDLFPQAYIRVIKFLDVNRGTGERLSVADEGDIRIEGPIPRAIMDASATIDQFMPQRRSLGASGLFEGRPIVPRDAWLEGLVNAVIHRSYSLSGDHIRVEIYPDRVEIESPGRFPGLANPRSPLEISRFARNPRIARVCADLRIGQEMGEGIKRIFDEMRLMGLTDPIYSQTQGSVKLTLQSIPRLDAGAAARLPKRSEEVLRLLRAADRPLSTGEIAESMEMSRPTVIRRLKALQEEGLVDWNGNTPNDPRAHWVIRL